MWCWDQAALRATLDQHGATDLPLEHVLPETLLQAPLTAEEGQAGPTLRLVHGLDGFEAQAWVAGQLVGSRWWPEAPDAAQWLAFQRGLDLHGVEPGAGVPPPQPLPAAVTLPSPQQPWLAQAWASVHGLGQAGQAALNRIERWAYPLLVVLCAVPATWLAWREVQLRQATAYVRSQLEDARAGAATLLDAREQALATRARMQAIEQLQPLPQPLQLMAALARALPPEAQEAGVNVKEWEINGSKLRVLLASPQTPLAGAQLVAALESTHLLSRVNMLTQADPRQMAFTADIVALADVVAAPAAGSAASGARP